MSEKRYVVSFVEPRVDSGTAAQILSTKKTRVKDGIEALAAEEPLDEAEVHNFEELGCCVVSLGDAAREKLEHDDRVAEVVEDFEVFAIGDCAGEDAEGAGDPPATFGGAGYAVGYHQALSDLYGAGDWADYDVEPAFHRPFPPRAPFPPRPPLPPTPPSLCPPGTRPVVRCVPVPRPPVRQPVPWNIGMVGADDVWRRVTGRGVKLAIIDTGIDDNHPDLSVSGGASLVPGVGSWDDDHSHGTHCAGIAGARNNAAGVVGVAPGCSLYAVKVMRPVAGGGASGRLSWILAGMGWAAGNGMDVASMSLGSSVSSADASCTVAYQRAAQQLIDSGCIVIAAAGNSGRTSQPWVGRPARCPGFMAVAAVDRNRGLASFSSRGPATLGRDSGVEISAPGVSINSTVPGGGYGVKSGTSMACPHVSGAAALIKELRPTWSPAQIRRRLRATASDLGAPGDDPEFGSGLLDCRRAVFG